MIVFLLVLVLGLLSPAPGVPQPLKGRLILKDFRYR
jgi:hypothetical protein